jgi:predicted ATPase
LEDLNVLIGPNGAGKSNLIEALALMRAAPIAPQTTSNADVRGVVRRGGGAQEWVWKGAKDQPACIELIVNHPKGKKPLRHVFKFAGDAPGFWLDDERIEDESPYGDQTDPYFYYRFNGGHPVVNVAGQQKRKLALETVNLEQSILSQRRDPEIYPEITYLADTYEKWRI